jgi:hypothetical protein
MKKLVAVTLMAAQLAACATAPEKISGSYVSPAMYSGYDCIQLRAEMQRVSYKVDEVTGAQRSKARSDEIAMGVGLIIFWPALFFIGMGSDRKAELQSLKGSYDAINEASIMHRCGLSDEPAKVADVAKAKPASAPVPAAVAPVAPVAPISKVVAKGPEAGPPTDVSPRRCGIIPQADGTTKLVPCR